MITKTKGWCPSLEKPMESGDGLLVRIPIKFGMVSSEIAQKIAELSEKYGNGHLDLSNRGNLQLRGVSEKTYAPLRAELCELGIRHDFNFQIIANPFDKQAQEVAEKLYSALSSQNLKLPEKFLIVIDSGGIFPLLAMSCDLYIKPRQADIEKIILALKNVKKCDKKSTDINKSAPIGFIPLTQQYGVVCIAATFGRIEAEQLKKIADIAKKYGEGQIIFAPFRRVILSNISNEESNSLLEELSEIGFITKYDDPRLNIHACVGAPYCSSALGDTRQLAQKWADDHPDNTKIVHITGCSKGCAYHGKADITITATQAGYEIT